jgi:hypothetical protein
LNVPVQPDESTAIDWTADLFWDILMEYQTILSDRFNKSVASASSSFFNKSFTNYDDPQDPPEQPIGKNLSIIIYIYFPLKKVFFKPLPDTNTTFPPLIKITRLKKIW